MGFANQVKVTAKLLNCRSQPSMSAQILGTIKMDEVHNIVAEQNGWGQLKNGSWINLKFTVPYECRETVEMPEIFVTGMSMVDEEQSEMVADITTSVTAATKDYIALHRVKRGESLWDIAELYYGKGEGMRYLDIKKNNNLKSDILPSDMILKIPKQCK